MLLLQRAGVRIVIPVTQCKNSAGRGKGEVQSPWHGHGLPDGELLVIAALLVLEDTLIASGRPQQRHTALLVRAVPGNAVLDDNSTLWRVIAGHQAVTCTTAWLPEPSQTGWTAAACLWHMKQPEVQVATGLVASTLVRIHMSLH